MRYRAPVPPRLAAPLATALLLLALAAAADGASSNGARAAARPTRITCLNRAGSATVFRRKPRTCADYGPGGAFGGGVFLRRLRWRDWGRGTARARGIECGFHLPCASIEVRVRAYRLRRGCRGTRVYTRLKARSRHGSTVVRLRRCPGAI
jgi:hypothetical protein